MDIVKIRDKYLNRVRIEDGTCNGCYFWEGKTDSASMCDLPAEKHNICYNEQGLACIFKEIDPLYVDLIKVKEAEDAAK